MRPEVIRLSDPDDDAFRRVEFLKTSRTNRRRFAEFFVEGVKPIDGWARVRASFDGDLDAAFRDVLQLAPDVVVLDPPELRARVLDAARALAALHAET